MTDRELPAWDIQEPAPVHRVIARDVRFVFRALGPHQFSWKLALSFVVGVVAAVYVLFGPNAAPFTSLTPSAWAFILLAAFTAGDAIGDAFGKLLELGAPAIKAPPSRAYDAIKSESIPRADYVRGFALLAIRGAVRAGSVLALAALLAWSYSALPASAQGNLFGAPPAAGMFGAFIDQLGIGVLDSFVFFLTEEARAGVFSSLDLTPLQPATVEGVLLVAGLKLYGFIGAFALLRILFAPFRIQRSLAALRQIVSDVRGLPAVS